MSFSIPDQNPKDTQQNFEACSSLIWNTVVERANQAVWKTLILLGPVWKQQKANGAQGQQI